MTCVVQLTVQNPNNIQYTIIEDKEKQQSWDQQMLGITKEALKQLTKKTIFKQLIKMYVLKSYTFEVSTKCHMQIVSSKHNKSN